MGLFSSFLSTAKKVTVIHPDFNFPENINKSFDPANTILSAQLTCEKINSEQLAKLPLEVYRSDDESGKLKNKEHRLYDLVHSSPNNWQTQTLFFQQLEKWRLHEGDAFAKIHRDNAGYETSFTHIQPGEITAYKIDNGQLYFLRVWDEGGKEHREVLNNDDVLHFRFTSNDGIFGLNPTKILLSELENIYQGKTTLNKSYKNNLHVDKYFKSTIKNFDSKQAQANITEIRKEYSGSLNTGKVPFLPDGFDLVPVKKSTFQDAQVLESIGFSKRDIAALYGTPLHLLGIDGQSYNSIEAQTINFKTNTLQPVARMYRQELEKKLLSVEDKANGISIEFNLNAVVEVEMKTRVEYLKALHGMGVVSSNAIAKIEGFDTYEGGDLHFIQSQNIPVEEYEKYAKIQATKPTKKEDQ